MQPRCSRDARLAARSQALDAAAEGRGAPAADVDAASIVLMGGIAAEALAFRSAEGGASDERDLRLLLEAQEGRDAAGGEGGEGGAAGGEGEAGGKEELRLAPAAHARWAAANAALLLRAHAPALAALEERLRAGATVGECAVSLSEHIPPPPCAEPSEQAWPRSAAAFPERRETTLELRRGVARRAGIGFGRRER